MDDGLPHLGADTLQTRAARSEAIFEARQRARDQFTDQFDTVDDPRDVPIRRREGGFGPGRGFLEEALPREAAHDLDPQFPNQDLGPDDVQRTGGGQFAPTEGVRRRSAAFGFEERTPLDSVDPFGDLVAQQGGGFGLDQQAQREAAARDLDPQFPNVDVGRDDVQRSDDGGFGLNQQARREVAAADLDPQFPAVDIGTGDLAPADGGGFGLDQQAQREVAAERFERQTPLEEVDSGDVRDTDDGFQLRDSVIRENRGLFR